MLYGSLYVNLSLVAIYRPDYSLLQNTYVCLIDMGVLSECTGIREGFSTFGTLMLMVGMVISMCPFGARCVKMFITNMAPKHICQMFFIVVRVPEF